MTYPTGSALRLYNYVKRIREREKTHEFRFTAERLSVDGL